MSVTINDFGASGGSHSSGVVPDPGAAAGTSKFLREDATWSDPFSGRFFTDIASTTASLSVSGTGALVQLGGGGNAVLTPPNSVDGSVFTIKLAFRYTLSSAGNLSFGIFQGSSYTTSKCIYQKALLVNQNDGFSSSNIVVSESTLSWNNTTQGLTGFSLVQPGTTGQGFTTVKCTPIYSLASSDIKFTLGAETTASSGALVVTQFSIEN